MVVLASDLESTAQQETNKENHVVLGGEEVSRKIETPNNNTSFDANENLLEKVELQKFSLFDRVYTNQAPFKILERWVPLGAGLLSSSTTALTYSPFGDILEADYVRQALKSFVWLRAAVEVKLVYATSIWNYGAVFITNTSGGTLIGTQNYAWAVAGTPGPQGSYYSRLLSHDPIILDLSQQEEVVFDLPWISPANAVSLPQFYNTSNGSNARAVSFLENMFRFSIYQVTPTGALDSSVITNFNFNLFARFKDPVVQGFTYDNTVLPPVEAQSGFVMDAMSQAATRATPVVSSWLNSQVDKALKSGLGAASDFLSGYIDTDVIQETLVTGQERKEVPRTSTNVLPDMYGDMVMGNQMIKSPLPFVVTQSAWHKVTDFLQKPSFYTYIPLSVVETDTYFIPIPSLIGVTNNCDRINWLAQYCRFWRGSIIYTYMFMASPMISTKVRLTLFWNTLDDPTVHPESLLTRIITIRGTTTVDIPVPFLYAQQWLPTDQTYSDSDVMFPRLAVALYQPIYSPGDVDPIIQCYVWRRAGPDFAFSSIRDASSFDTTSGLVKKREPQFVRIQAEAQMRLSTMETMEIPMLAASNSEVFHGRDCVHYIEDIASRFSLDQDSSTLSSYPVDYNASNGHGNCDTISNIFYFFRGSMDMKAVVGTAGTSTKMVVAADDYTDYPIRVGYNVVDAVSNGQVIIDPRFTGVLETTLPALAAYEWISIPNDVFQYYPNNSALPLIYRLLTDGTGTVVSHVIRRISKDSSFYYEVPPPFSQSWASY